VSLARADVRFAGQEYTITVPIEQEWLGSPASLSTSLREAFVALHQQLYGHGDAAAPLELVTLRVRGIGEVETPQWPEWMVASAATAVRRREVWFQNEGRVDTPVFDRTMLAREQVVEGPAIVEEWTTTTVVPPGWMLRVDRLGNLLLQKGPTA
jgi:N-methylhydantoinase A